MGNSAHAWGKPSIKHAGEGAGGGQRPGSNSERDFIESLIRDRAQEVEYIERLHRDTRSSALAHSSLVRGRGLSEEELQNNLPLHHKGRVVQRDEGNAEVIDGPIDRNCGLDMGRESVAWKIKQETAMQNPEFRATSSTAILF